VKHIFYAEELENFKGSFKYLVDVKNRFFETTYLDNLQISAANNYGTLPSTLTARLSNPSKSRPERLQAVIDPLPAFMGILDVNFDELVRGVREFQGEVIVQAEFGRLLAKRIHSRFITRQGNESSHVPKELLGILEPPTGAAPSVFFTKVLTTLPADITYLVEIKDRRGDRMWKHQQSSSDVLYEILCLDRRQARHHPFTVEVDGDKLNLGARAKTRRKMGSINVHGIKRHWDFRIAATGVATLEDTDPAYAGLANAVSRTLNIR
jgi:hypothetical protein